MFEKLMFKLRQNMEVLFMQNTLFSVEVNVLKEEINDLKSTVSTLKSTVYEKEFKQLCYSISSPIKENLVRCFRNKNIRMDPLDKYLIRTLLNDD